jgi:hypothetical protein
MEPTELVSHESKTFSRATDCEHDGNTSESLPTRDVLNDYCCFNKGDLAIVVLGKDVSPIIAMVGIEEMVLNGKMIAGMSNSKTAHIQTLVCGSDRNLKLATDVRERIQSASKRSIMLVDGKPSFQHLSVEGARATINATDAAAGTCVSIYQGCAALDGTDSLPALQTWKDFAAKKKLKVLMFVGEKNFDKGGIAAQFADHIIRVETCESDAGWESAMSLESKVLVDLLGSSNADTTFLQAKGLRDQLKFAIEPFLSADAFSRSIWKLAESGMAQSTIAEKVGKNKSTISRILEKMPKIDKRQRNASVPQHVAEVA